MRVCTTIASFLSLMLGIGSVAWSEQPSLKECLITTKETGNWTATRENLVSWDFSFSEDGTFSAESNGVLTYQNKFSREQTVAWEQKAKGTWELNTFGDDATLKLNVKEVEHTFSKPLPTAKDMLGGKEVYGGMLPQKKEFIEGKATFRLIKGSTPKRIMWTQESGNPVFTEKLTKEFFERHNYQKNVLLAMKPALVLEHSK